MSILKTISRKAMVGDGLTNDELLRFLDECKNAVEILTIFGPKYSLFRNEFNNYLFRYSDYAKERHLIIRKEDYFPDWKSIDEMSKDPKKFDLHLHIVDLLNFMEALGDPYSICVLSLKEEITNQNRRNL